MFELFMTIHQAQSQNWATPQHSHWVVSLKYISHIPRIPDAFDQQIISNSKRLSSYLVVKYRVAVQDSYVKVKWKLKFKTPGFYLLGGEGVSFLPKVLLKKKFTAISNKDLFLTTILRNQWRLLMSRNAISANPEHYIFKIFQGSMSPDPPRSLKKIFLAAAWLKNFFQDRLPPPPSKNW